MSSDAQGPLRIRLSEERRRDLVGSVKRHFTESYDEELSDFRAEQLIDFFVAALGPAVYNQAVQDARAFLQAKLDDLEGDVYEPEPPR